MMPLGAAALPLHLVPRIEFNVGRLDEELLVPLLDLLLQRWRVHPGQGVAVQGDQLGGNLHNRDRKKLQGGSDNLLDTCRVILHGAGSAAQRMSARG